MTFAPSSRCVYLSLFGQTECSAAVAAAGRPASRVCLTVSRQLIISHEGDTSAVDTINISVLYLIIQT